jgi:hypothetical protein
LAAKRTHQRAQAVRIGHGEVAVSGEPLDLVDHIVTARQRLRGEPFVEHQRIVRIALVKAGQRRRPLRLCRRVDQGAERPLPIRHIVRLLELPQRNSSSIFAAAAEM